MTYCAAACHFSVCENMYIMQTPICHLIRCVSKKTFHHVLVCIYTHTHKRRSDIHIYIYFFFGATCAIAHTNIMWKSHSKVSDLNSSNCMDTTTTNSNMSAFVINNNNNNNNNDDDGAVSRGQSWYSEKSVQSIDSNQGNVKTKSTPLPIAFNKNQRPKVEMRVTSMYLCFVLLPILVVGVSAIAAGFAGIGSSNQANISYMRELAEASLEESATTAAAILSRELQPVSLLVQIMRSEAVNGVCVFFLIYTLCFSQHCYTHSIGHTTNTTKHRTCCIWL